MSDLFHAENSEAVYLHKNLFSRPCSRLEAKCLIKNYLKVPYDLVNALNNAGLTRIGHLRGKTEQYLRETIPVSHKRIALLIEQLDKKSIAFPVSFEYMESDCPESFFSTFVDSAFFPQSLTAAPLNNREIAISASALAKLKAIGITSINDLVGIPDEFLLTQGHIGQSTLEKVKVRITRYAVNRGIADPVKLERGYKEAAQIQALVEKSQSGNERNCHGVSFDTQHGFKSAQPLEAPTTLANWLAEKTSAQDFATSIGITEVSASRTMGEIALEDIRDDNAASLSIIPSEQAEALKILLAENAARTSQAIPPCLASIPFDLLSRIALPEATSIGNATFAEVIDRSKHSLGLSYACELLGKFLSEQYALTAEAQTTDQLVNQVLLDSSPHLCDTHVYIYKQRHGLAGKKQTLQQIADTEGVTRERVRQIAKKIEDSLDMESESRLIIPRVLLVAAALDAQRNPIDFQHIYSAEGFLDDPFTLATFVPDVEIHGKDITIAEKRDRCFHCEKLRDVLEGVCNSEELITQDELIESVGCDQCAALSLPSPSCIRKSANLEAIDGYVGPASNPVIRSLKHPQSDRAAIASILYQSKTPLNYDSILALFKEKTGRTLTKPRAMSHFGSIKGSLLWGRETYLHERFAPNPASLIDEVENRVMELFRENGVPILGVGGVFELFKTRLIDSGVPNEQALYSLIRLHDYNELRLQEYPWICLDEEIGDRTSFAKFFYSVLAKNNGFITNAHAEAIATRAMAQSFALSGLAEYSPFLINANGGWYDIEAAHFDLKGVAQLATEVAANMKDSDIVSAEKVFEDHKERCHTLGVKSFDILYYLVDMLEDDLPIEATRKPHFVKSQHKGVSVRSFVRRYIQDANKPVTHLEIVEEFCVHRGIKERSLSPALFLSDDIVAVGDDVYWSKAAMGLDEAYLQRFDNVIAESIASCKKVAGLFFPIDSIASRLATLDSPIGTTWNSRLIATVFSESPTYRLFGEADSCVIDLSANPEITTTERFYVALLNNEFMGWSSFDAFAEYCKTYGIRKQLTPEFFDAFDAIEADAACIQVV